MKFLAVLSLIFTLQAQAKCQKLNLMSIKSSEELAVKMGKLKIFDAKLMSKYNDGETIPSGEIILLTFNEGAQQILQGLRLAHDRFSYRPKGLPPIEARMKEQNDVVLVGGNKQRFCLVSQAEILN